MTRDEWLAAVDAAGFPQDNDPDATTVPEFMAMFGISRSTAGQRLNAMVDKGLAVKTRKVMRTTYGRMVSHIAYRLTPKKAKQR